MRYGDGHVHTRMQGRTQDFIKGGGAIFHV